MLENPILYIIMRSDIAQMNPGKGMAQAAHAANDFVESLHDYDPDSALLATYEKWKEDRSFGTTIVLSGTIESIHSLLQKVLGEVVVDPTYPMTSHYGVPFVRNEFTCAWLFPISEEEITTIKESGLGLHQ